MEPLIALLLAAAAFAAGALNAVLGGGTFITFPALVFAGVQPLVANATNCVLLWPAALASAFGYAWKSPGERPLGVEARRVWVLAGMSGIGGALGAGLLLATPETRFARLVPGLLLFATVLFTFGRRWAERLGSTGAHRSFALTAGVQLLIAVYGGYFGGGMGILMLGAFTILGLEDMNAMNALRSIMGAVINGIAVVVFAVSESIAWGPALAMAVAASLGGYAGARIARQVPPRILRGVVLTLAWSTTALFFFDALRSP